MAECTRLFIGPYINNLTRYKPYGINDASDFLPRSGMIQYQHFQRSEYQASCKLHGRLLLLYAAGSQTLIMPSCGVWGGGGWGWMNGVRVT